ncbi:MAG: FAD-dependent oxidoreductase [Gemmatimonadetes bacterium]|nr:MAG: FAD-dependent oxidoreductase [Gemmatimonadota bacterium]
MKTPDFLVVGGGIIGVTLALELQRRHRGAAITLLEKEPVWGRHASGRNSGVLHAGFYYTADSLKARFTRDGNARLTSYCNERGLPINRCGKLVVARTPAEVTGLAQLLSRGRANGVPLEEISSAEARQLEPRVKTCERALFSPTTSAVDPLAVLQSLVADAAQAGITIMPGVAYVGRAGRTVRTSAGPVSPGYCINAAGLYADRVAREWGFAERWGIVPFKGLYLSARPGSPPFQRHIYPVPELSRPFLGVHVTVGVDGGATLGPTAIPAFWREQYSGWSRFRLSELGEILVRDAGLFLRNAFGFRALALDELRNYRRGRIVSLAAELAEGIHRADFPRWGRAGIRAQLVDVRENRLEMDFKYEGDDRSFHVLNAVSPGFTCALPFAAHLADEIERLRR